MRIWLSRPHMSGNELKYVQDAFDSNFVAPIGPQLNAFEASVQQYMGEDYHCVALSSGSAALQLGLRIVGVEKGDEVWIGSMTFAGGIFPVLYVEATPVFFDLSPESWTLDCDVLEAALVKANAENRLPKAIVPTDLYGQSVDIVRLEKLSERFGVALVFDSAESLGATAPNGRKSGTGGDIAILSFNGNKIITTSGGGMLISSNKDYVDQALFLSTQARDPAPHYEHSTVGYNFRLSNVSAAIGIGQMEVLEDRVSRRREIFERYKNALTDCGFAFMPEPQGYRSTRWLTACYLDPKVVGKDREAVREMLLKEQIESRPMWKPMHMQPIFEGTRYKGPGLDEKLFENGLCLPSGSDMTNEEQDEVIERVQKFVGEG